MEAARQHVQEEAPHELLRGEGHGLVPCAARHPVILPAEGEDAWTKVMGGDKRSAHLNIAVGAKPARDKANAMPAKMRFGGNPRTIFQQLRIQRGSAYHAGLSASDPIHPA
jgi:hypothetical protein